MPGPLKRFDLAPERPPPDVVHVVAGADAGPDEHTGDWHPTRLGQSGAYPNGGIWRYDRMLSDGSVRTCFLKRTGPRFLGGDPMWANALDRDDPNWWGREAAFYESGLAVDGWTDEVSAARCLTVADGPGHTRDVWLELVEMESPTLEVCRAVVASLAAWQVAHRQADDAVLSIGWVSTHLARRRLDNARTLAGAGWDVAQARGLDPIVRDWVPRRLTDPGRVAAVLASFPQALTHFDLHPQNLGRRVDGTWAILDWAYVGWGAIGQDVGQLAIDAWSNGDVASTPAELLDDLLESYLDALRAAGDKTPVDLVVDSVITTLVIRHGWVVDHALALAGRLSDEEWARQAPVLELIARLGVATAR